MSEQKLKGQMTVLRNYFGALPGQGLKAFSDEVKQLSDAEKLDLAQGAARNLGLTQDEVNFPLS